MKRLLMGLALTLAASATDGAMIGHPVTNPVSGAVYALLAPASWNAAEAEAEGLGGHLFKLRTSSDLNVAISYLTAELPGPREYFTPLFWTGLHSVEGTRLVWADNSTYDPANSFELNGARPYGNFAVAAGLGGSYGFYTSSAGPVVEEHYGIVELARPVPEPKTIVLLLIGSIVLLCGGYTAGVVSRPPPPIPERSMIRELLSHKVNGLNAELDILVTDEPGEGGSNHYYEVRSNRGLMAQVKFQKGPVAEYGVNGVSNEALLAIIEDRLKGFQTGKYATADNARALEFVRDALTCLKSRTQERIDRGVEGTSAI